MKNIDLFIAEPYRVFFPLGWFACIIGVGYWLLISLGYPLGYNPTFHALIQIELFCGAFAVGFLLTALPKFLHASVPSKKEFLSFLATYFVLSSLLLSGSIYLSQIVYIFFLLQLVAFAILRISSRKNSPPHSFYIIPLGILQGIIGAALIIWPITIFPQLGQKFLYQGMLLSLVLGVGSFLGPRLMGIVDTSSIVVSFSKVPNKMHVHKDPKILVVLLGFLIFISFIIESGLNKDIGLCIRAAASFCFFYYFGIFKLPKSQSIVGLLVALSLWSVIFSICIATIYPQYEVSFLHIQYIGGFGFLILTIGAQVITSHGKVPTFWHRHKAHSLLLASLVFVSIFFRVLVSINGGINFNYILISSILFIIALILWGLGLFRYLTSGKNNVS